ncbi:MAG: hypothetical protein HY429_00125 [Candidatus Levybacteria bacterium]|nr:hypothetical protein [Candidatus Levybacteria bacterium]
MKKVNVFILFALFFFLFTFGINAATPTPLPTKDLSDQVSELKERIASRVAQLKLVERRSIIGKVTDVSGTQLTIKDIHEKDRFVDVDELTKFSSPSAKESFGISDITKGTTIGILGLHNKESKRLLARFVGVVVLPVFLHGVVTDIDAQNFAFTVAGKSDTYTIDFETSTRSLTYNSEEDMLERSGFSKITVGQRVSITGYESKADKNRIAASRVLRLPDIPKNPAIKTKQPNVKAATPSAKEQ